MGSGIKGNWSVTQRDDGTGGNLEVAETMKAKTLVVEETAVLPGVVIDNHVHDASAIISGTIDAARLPKGDGNDDFGVIKIGTAGGLDLSDGILTIDAAALSTLLQLGTAAGADTGTASGNVPILDGSGRLPISVMPAQTIGGEYLGEVANAESMVILSQATSGDFCKRLDTGTYWMLGSSAPGAYSNAANWLEYAGAVTTVNGVIGAVTQSDLGLVTAVSANSDITFPSCKATADYIAGRISGLGDVYAKLTDLDGYAVTGHQHLTAPDTAVPASGIITLEPNKTHYTKTITGNTVIGFDAENLNTNDIITFELLVKTVSTVYPVLFGSTITWLNGDEPYFNDPNTAHLLAFRSYDGGDSWIGSYQGKF